MSLGLTSQSPVDLPGALHTHSLKAFQPLSSTLLVAVTGCSHTTVPTDVTALQGLQRQCFRHRQLHYVCVFDSSQPSQSFSGHSEGQGGKAQLHYRRWGHLEVPGWQGWELIIALTFKFQLNVDLCAYRASTCTSEGQVGYLYLL